MKRKISISPSKLKLLRECPCCFWHEYRGDKRPQAKIGFPTLGSGMDAAFKTYFDRHMENGTLPKEILEIEPKAKLFDNKELLDVWQQNFKGLQLEKDPFLLRGAIDNLLIIDGKICVIDYKTRGYPIKEDTHTYYIDQMTCYNYLLNELGHETTNYAYLLFYYPSQVDENDNILFKCEPVKIDINTREAEILFKRAMLTIESDYPPQSDETCEFCKWRKE